MLKSNTDKSTKTQICKGMAEIYAEILNSVGIEAKSVGTNMKGQKQEVSENEAKHFYTLFKVGDQEYVQDFLIESALMRIKVGEAELAEKMPGICLLDEYEKYGQISLKQIDLSKEYLKNVFGNNLINLSDNEINEELEQLQMQGYNGRKLRDRKYLQLENKKQKILRKQKELYQGNNERKENNGNIKIIKEKIKSNDLISEYIITPSQIGKKSIDAHIGMKDIEKRVVDRKIEERTNLQELNLHNHNGSQVGTNEGR